MKDHWGQFGGKLGIGYCVAGLFLVFLGWNGAASYYDLQAQFPYLISGGIAGLCLVVIGAAVLVAQRAREDRASLEGSINELRVAIERLGTGQGSVPSTSASGTEAEVVAGPHAYHVRECRVIEGQVDLIPMTVAAAQASNRSACRVCQPDSA